jgi:hypothetical protein
MYISIDLNYQFYVMVIKIYNEEIDRMLSSEFYIKEVPVI